MTQQAKSECGDRPCRRCGVPLSFMRGAKSGKLVPLDLKAPCFVAYSDGNGELWCLPAKEWLWAMQQARTPEARAALTERIEGVYTSHFSTCPHANEFHRKQPAKQEVRQ